MLKRELNQSGRYRAWTFVLGLMVTATCGMMIGCGDEDGESTLSGSGQRGYFGEPPKDVRTKTDMAVSSSVYGTTEGGEEVTEFTCINANGMEMKMISYGATMTSLKTCDKNGDYANIVLGYDTLAEYEAGTAYFGATVGRFCNRIAGGKFTIDDQEYTLATNNGENHLHGGDVGFSKKVWNAEAIEEDNRVGVRFTLTSPDGDEGYPGNVEVTAVYTIDNEDVLNIELSATTDAKTHVNLTNHNYWNLAGAGSGTILDHRLSMNCPEYLAVDDTLIPTGEMVLVENTALDMTAGNAIGDRIDEVQIGDGPKGYDHCFIIRDTQFPAAAASLVDPESGRVMDIVTSMRGVQLYTGNFLDGTPEVGGFKQYEGLCLETQLFPDSPNKAGVRDYTNSLLNPGRRFTNNTTFKFSYR